MLNLTRPRYLVPVHGDHKRIHLHAQLGEATGVDADRIFKLENGIPLDFHDGGARVADRVRSGMIFVDGLDVGDPTEAALRDRQTLATDGVLFVVATVSEQDGETVTPPEIVLRGVPELADRSGFERDLRACVEGSLDRAAADDVHELDLLEKALHEDLTSFVGRRLRRRPMILPVVVEV